MYNSVIASNDNIVSKFFVVEAQSMAIIRDF
jgi:hypothetical protein